MHGYAQLNDPNRQHASVAASFAPIPGQNANANAMALAAPVPDRGFSNAKPRTTFPSGSDNWNDRRRYTAEFQTHKELGEDMDVDEEDLRDAGFAQTEEDADTSKVLIKAWGLATVFEAFLCGTATALFLEKPDSQWALFAMWAWFLLTFLIRAMVEHFYAPDEDDRRDRMFMVVIIYPIVVYLPLIIQAYLNECTYHSKTQVLPGFDMNLGIGIQLHDDTISYKFYTIQCEGAIPANAMMGVQAASQALVPSMFAYMFVKLGSSVWGFDLLRNVTRFFLQLAMLNLLDCVTFVTMASQPATFVYMEKHSSSAFLVNFLFVVAYTTVIAQIIIMSPQQTLWFRNFQSTDYYSERVYLGMTLLLVDVPLLCVRLFLLLHVHATVSIPMILKNSLCILNAICHIKYGETNGLSTMLRTGVNMLPGAETVRQETAGAVFRKFSSSLDQNKKALAAKKKEMEAAIQQFEEEQKLQDTLVKLNRWIKNSKKLNGQLPSESEVKEVFLKFDFDGDGFLDTKELDKIRAIVTTNEEQAEAFPIDGMMEECHAEKIDGVLSVHIVDFARVFLERLKHYRDHDHHSRHSDHDHESHNSS